MHVLTIVIGILEVVKPHNCMLCMSSEWKAYVVLTGSPEICGMTGVRGYGPAASGKGKTGLPVWGRRFAAVHYSERREAGGAGTENPGMLSAVCNGGSSGRDAIRAPRSFQASTGWALCDYLSRLELCESRGKTVDEQGFHWLHFERSSPIVNDT